MKGIIFSSEEHTQSDTKWSALETYTTSIMQIEQVIFRNIYVHIYTYTHAHLYTHTYAYMWEQLVKYRPLIVWREEKEGRNITII